MLPHRFLEQRLQQCVSAILPDADASTLQVRPCPNPEFGDYQTSALISLAKERKRNPRELALNVVRDLGDLEWFAPPEIAGPGFLNFRLKPERLSGLFQKAIEGGQLFFEKAARPRSIVLDFSSPNVAKPMHVGHIRATLLGDSLARILRLLGHRVVTDNHLGDWGTQFGKLLVGWKEHLDPAALEADPLSELERLYKLVNAACVSDPSQLEKARHELVKLQSGDPQNLKIWEEMIALSRKDFDHLYQTLGITFDYTLGESFYNSWLQGVVQQLRDLAIAQESEGALVAFFEDDKELKGHPALIQKSDGAFNYMSTDLATIQYRLETWRPDEIVYVTDGRQQLHFKQLFAIFRKWHPKTEIKLSHVWFGTILGEDGKPFRTRSGETIRLKDLIYEAQERALKVVSEKSAELDESQRRDIARIVGLGALKYADLLPNRQSDYVFSWDKMLAFNGNTAPYLQYAYTRIRSMFRKLESVDKNAWKQAPVNLAAEAEMVLGKHLMNFGLVLETVAQECRPNFLCNYLYDLAGYFARFYEACPVLKAEAAVQGSRLRLCDSAARVLKQGLEVLGIEVTEQM